MSAKLEAGCAMCGKEITIPIRTDACDEQRTIAETVRNAGWIVQQNGPNLDIYCSEKCAK